MDLGRRLASTLFSIVYVTVPSMEVGQKIARDVVHNRLAACVNIVPQVTSIYEWNGKVEEEKEFLLMMKTSSEQLDALKQAVIKLHPYDVPEFVAVPIEYGSEPYLKWLKAQTTPKDTESSSANKTTRIGPDL